MRIQSIIKHIESFRTILKTLNDTKGISRSKQGKSLGLPPAINSQLINQNHSSEYRLYRVAFATFGYPFASAGPFLIAPSIPLSFCSKIADGAIRWEGPCAEGARRVFGNPKLRFGSPKTSALVLLHVSLCSTTKQ